MLSAVASFSHVTQDGKRCSDENVKRKRWSARWSNWLPRWSRKECSCNEKFLLKAELQQSWKKFQFDRQLQPASWKVWVIARLSKSQWFDAQQEQMGKNVWNFSTINFAEKFFCISQRKSFSTKIVKKTFMCRSNAMQWEKNKNTFHSHLLRKKR